jgi:hypothetical protein
VAERLRPRIQNASPAGQCGYTLMRQKNQQYPADGRARIMNYSKGVAFWESDAEASTFVNGNGTNYTQGTPGGFQNIVSADNYWFTDSDLQDTSQGAEFYGHGWGDPSPRNLTFDEAHRAYNYALTIKRVRTSTLWTVSASRSSGRSRWAGGATTPRPAVTR